VLDEVAALIRRLWLAW